MRESVAAVVAAGTATVAATVLARRTRTSLVDRDRTATHVGAGQFVDCLARVVVAHLDEAEAPRAAGFPIGDDLSGGDRTNLAEQRGEVVRSGGEGQVAHVQIDDSSSVVNAHPRAVARMTVTRRRADRFRDCNRVPLGVRPGASESVVQGPPTDDHE